MSMRGLNEICMKPVQVLMRPDTGYYTGMDQKVIMWTHEQISHEPGEASYVAKMQFMDLIWSHMDLNRQLRLGT